MRFALSVVAVLIAGSAMADTSSPAGSWLAEDIRGGGVIDNLQTTLEIASDGSVSGTGGCNRYFGKAEIDEASIAFGPLGSTKMACAPAVMDQEQKFFDALTEVAGWHLESTGHLVLLDTDGKPLVRLIEN